MFLIEQHESREKYGEDGDDIEGDGGGGGCDDAMSL